MCWICKLTDKLTFKYCCWEKDLPIHQRNIRHPNVFCFHKQRSDVAEFASVPRQSMICPCLSDNNSHHIITSITISSRVIPTPCALHDIQSCGPIVCYSSAVLCRIFVLCILVASIYATFGADLINIYKVTSCNTKCLVLVHRVVISTRRRHRIICPVLTLTCSFDIIFCSIYSKSSIIAII